MIDEKKLLEDVLNTISEYTDSIYEISDQNNIKTLAYINGYCDMASKILEWKTQGEIINKEIMLNNMILHTSVYTDCIFDENNESNTKTLAYISGYNDMNEKILEWLEEKLEE